MEYPEGAIPFDVGLGRLKGRKLTSVNFIHDYVQFGFESAGMSVFAGPVLLVEDVRLDWHSRRLRHELCNLIGQEIVATQVDETQALMRFERGAELILPFHDPENPSPESLHFTLDDGDGVPHWWVL